jgi:hypothetical protein
MAAGLYDFIKGGTTGIDRIYDTFLRGDGGYNYWRERWIAWGDLSDLERMLRFVR